MIKEMNFNENLKELLLSSGVSQRAVSKWIIGQSEPTATNLFKIALFFNVSADFLIGLKDE